ncbi:hypothetical protein SMU85_00399 [Streptococcus mutans ST6]|uniref:hypothetical protein n=1 Tax=Streptococcus mutans TaxID=1309 RepID=UPI0002B54050|nr:hypothetical protein [Streptococcus mutans]EMC30124.1 hypothetical protein SMU85_00399 [Streptococcus mutans ST6]
MRGINYTKAIAIVHGQSEYNIVRYIKSKLRIPVWNDNNLEEVLNRIGYYYATNDKQKKNYKRAFPVERGSQDLKSIEKLRDELQNISQSNMDEFLTFCLNNCPKF